MLQTVLEHIHNMFVKDRYSGSYQISEGDFSSLPSMKEGQRFWVIGSDLNDGVYTYHAEGTKNDDDTEAAVLRDEEFSGMVCSLSIPASLLSLCVEIRAWVDKYGEAVNSPFKGESVIGVYSYTKATAAKANGGNPAVTWEDVFRSDLNRWRRVCF